MNYTREMVLITRERLKVAKASARPCRLLRLIRDWVYCASATSLRSYYHQRYHLKRFSQVDGDFLMSVCRAYPHGGLALANSYEEDPLDIIGLFVLAHQICDENDALLEGSQRKETPEVIQGLAGKHCAVIDNISSFFKENYATAVTDETV